MTLRLSMTCGPYDRARALIDGAVMPEGIELDVTVNGDDRARQAEARDGAFDVAEFFTGTYMADLSKRALGLTAIPIFVKRMFRHSYIYVNRRSGIRQPTDLHGKRVGVQQWHTTAALWARGILADDHGVDLSAIHWVAEHASPPDWQPPAWLKLELVPAGRTQRDLLFNGELDAGITTELWAPDVHPDVAFLFPNYAELERDYFRRTRFFPIHHTLVIKTSILDEHPWVAMSLFNAWQASKERLYDWLDWQRIHATSLGYRALWEQEHALVGGRDIYPWGFCSARAEIDKMLAYSVVQGLTTEKHEPEEMFHASTLQT